MRRNFLPQVMALAVLAGIAWCQGNLGGLTGRVADTSGAGVPAAVVRITNLDTAAEVQVLSSSDGAFLASNLPPGRYRAAVSKEGFKTTIQEPITISTATTSTVNFNLAVGQVNESVTVEGGAVELQTTNAEVGTVMPTKTILDLPISLGGAATTGATGRRQIENFIFLTPGVTGNQWSKSINGSPGFSQEVLIDGIDMQNIGAPGFIAEASPPYEAVEEFKVQNTMYPAEYGGGYGVMNFTLKSGVNAYHGDLFEFVRNDKFDSRGFFAAGKSMLRQNEFGGTFGGPLVIPKVYNGKDRTFFFVAYSGFRLRGGIAAGNLQTLPSALERGGDFSDYPFPIFDPATTRPDGNGGYVREPFANNRIPSNRIGGVAQRTLPLIPQPDFPGYFNNYINRQSQPSTDDDWSVKIDHQINSKQRISAAYWWVNGNTQINGPIAGELNPGYRNTPTEASGYRFNHTYTISPTLLNRIGVGYTPTSPTWSRWTLDPRLGNQTMQIPGIPLDIHGYPQLSFSGPTSYATLGNANNNGTDPQFFQNWSGQDDVSWVKGPHQLKFGFMWRRREMTVLDRRNEGGSFTFNALSTSQPNSSNFNNWGNPFASFLLGETYAASAAVPAPLRHYKDDFMATYVEDVIKLTPRLTMSLGLRYELPLYAKEKEGIISFLDLSRANPGAGGRPGALVFLGEGDGRTGTYSVFGSYHTGFSPRFALTYGLNNKTVLRMGYGIFRIETATGRLNGCNYWCSGFGLQPSYTSTDQGVTPVFNLAQGFPANPRNPPIFDPSLNNNGSVSLINWAANRMGLMQSWTFDIQRDLPFGIMLDAAYVGTKSSGTWTGAENPNQLNPSYLGLGQTLLADINSPQAAAAGVVKPYAGFTGSVAQALRPYPQYTNIDDMYQPTGYNFYNSFQLRIQKRYSNGMSFLTAYTLSKNIGFPGGDIFGDTGGGGGAKAMDTFNRKLEKTTVSGDQTHTLILSWNYELPFGRGKRFLTGINSVADKFIGGWQVNGIQTYRSGTLIAVGGGGALPIFGGGNRPNWISNDVRSSVSMSDFDPARDRYLNIAAFSQPAPYTFGNAPPRLPNVRTPFYMNEDISFFKNTYIHESMYVQLRGEFYNLFNRVVFGGPAASINNPSTFGIISSQANTPRLIQFAIKLIF
ncbi:MAG TPA: carboxypeptidase-like regulatory domain-containing protein [Bryobacteraceae bacterium]|nr:carboxypeptidase-like regulatory domain-containing protein [Bryobacteraceae bacterium]